MSKEEILQEFSDINGMYNNCTKYDTLKRLLEQEPCTDAVSREAVIEIVNDIRDCISVDGYWAILERLKKLPSFTQKSGKWINEKNDIPICSQCGYIPQYELLTNEEQALLQKWRDNRGISMEDFEDAINALQEPIER